MTAIANSYEPESRQFMLTETTSAVQTPGADVLMSTFFLSNVANILYICTTGNIAVKRVNDASFVVYPVTAGQRLFGRFAAVGGSGSGTTSNWIAEV
jgi:hypothetical protein